MWKNFHAYYKQISTLKSINRLCTNYFLMDFFIIVHFHPSTGFYRTSKTFLTQQPRVHCLQNKLIERVEET